LIINYFLSY